MRVFVTGATGFVGSAVVRELIGAGHRVLGLVRSDASAAALAATGAEAHRGSLDDPDSLQRGAAAADAIIHTGFTHDFSNFKAYCEQDRRAIAAMGSASGASGRPLIITSGIGVLSPGRLSIESDVPVTTSSSTPRVATEEAADALAAAGIPVSLVRLPPSVHGDGDHGFVPLLIGIAREKGLSVFAGEGGNRWPAVHRLDAAVLYRLVLEQAVAGGQGAAGGKVPVDGPGATGGKATADGKVAASGQSAGAGSLSGNAAVRYHAVAEEGVPFREIAEVIGRRLAVPVVSKSPEEAAAHFGWFAHFAAMNVPSSSAHTRSVLGWKPGGPGLIEDIDGENYFGA